MHRWVVICWALLALVCADDCPDGGACEDGHTCCNTPASGYGCCPLQQAECCEDHMHCCPEGTLCDVTRSSCVNASVSIPWLERVSANQPRLSKSFRMIRPYTGEEEDNVCPDQSLCPPEFSCQRALTKFGCCPLAQAIPCSDGKHCCPKDHQCSADCRSCIEKELVSAVRCSDGESECPEETTCCETPDGSWGCCPMPKAVCCEDKAHCCPEGSSCDVTQSKCISLSTKKETPMWAKFPARKRAEWENRNEGAQVTAKAIYDDEQSKKVPEFTAASTVPSFVEEEVSVSPVTKQAGNKVPCNDSVACDDGTTCCKTKEGGWACCPLPKAVCCADFVHCCPHGKKCNLPAESCDDDLSSWPWVEKVPTIPREGEEAGNVTCDSTASCPDKTTCCKTTTGLWACCPLPQAVCCDDHVHCCPNGMTCDGAGLTCNGPSGSVPMVEKLPAFTTPPPSEVETTTKVASTEEMEQQTEKDYGEQEEEEEDRIQCDPGTTCPEHTTCCFMTSVKKWGCCPLPKAVCCSDGNHCCPTHYTCDTNTTSCHKEEVVIPWYNKLPTESISQADPSSVRCDARNRCPEHSTCCKLFTGQWGCCPLQEAVCCPDRMHCCPQGYSCNMDTESCQKVIMLQLQTVPLTPVYVPKAPPQLYDSKYRNVKCNDTFSCKDGETCCKTSSATWGCCPSPNAVCCSDMKHCCPAGYTCDETGRCSPRTWLRWDNWQAFLGKNKRAAVL